MNHEKEIDRLGVEYSAGIEDFKKYVVRLFNMDPYELYDLFISSEMDREGYLEEYPENVAGVIIESFSARCIIDTLDSYDIEKEKAMENRIIEVNELLKPGNALYFHDGGRVYPILVLSWNNPYFGRSFPDRVLITFYDIISETIRSDIVVNLDDVREVDFAYNDIDDLVTKFMTALKEQTKDYFEWKDREERIKHDGEAPAKRCGRFKWEDKSHLYKAAEEALNKEREEREKAVIRNRIDELSYSGRSLRERFPNLYSEEDDD